MHRRKGAMASQVSLLACIHLGGHVEVETVLVAILTIISNRDQILMLKECITCSCRHRLVALPTQVEGTI